MLKIKSKKLICTSGIVQTRRRERIRERKRERERGGEEGQKRSEKWNIHGKKCTTGENSRPVFRRKVTVPIRDARDRSRDRISARSLLKIYP